MQCLACSSCLLVCLPNTRSGAACCAMRDSHCTVISVVSNGIQHPLLIYRRLLNSLNWIYLLYYVCCVCVSVCIPECVWSASALSSRLRLRQVLHTYWGSVCNQCPPRQPDHASEYSSLPLIHKHTQRNRKVHTQRNILWIHKTNKWNLTTCTR